MNYDDFLKTPRPCPFCSTGDRRIAENERAYLTYALAPYHPDHLLVIPKRHIVDILEVSDEEERDIYALMRTAVELLHAAGYENVSVLVRDGDGSMKSVSHLHYNVIPNTRLGDIDHLGRKRTLLSVEEQGAVVEKMGKLLSGLRSA